MSSDLSITPLVVSLPVSSPSPAGNIDPILNIASPIVAASGAASVSSAPLPLPSATLATDPTKEVLASAALAVAFPPPLPSTSPLTPPPVISPSILELETLRKEWGLDPDDKISKESGTEFKISFTNETQAAAFITKTKQIPLGGWYEPILDASDPKNIIMEKALDPPPIQETAEEEAQRLISAWKDDKRVFRIDMQEQDDGSFKLIFDHAVDVQSFKDGEAKNLRNWVIEDTANVKELVMKPLASVLPSPVVVPNERETKTEVINIIKGNIKVLKGQTAHVANAKAKSVSIKQGILYAVAALIVVAAIAVLATTPPGWILAITAAGLLSLGVITFFFAEAEGETPITEQYDAARLEKVLKDSEIFEYLIESSVVPRDPVESNESYALRLTYIATDTKIMQLHDLWKKRKKDSEDYDVELAKLPKLPSKEQTEESQNKKDLSDHTKFSLEDKIKAKNSELLANPPHIDTTLPYL